MKLVIITIALDAMPWIALHLPVFNRLKVDWHWHVVEGVALPVKDTKWVRATEPRLSMDGTHEYLQEIRTGRESGRQGERETRRKITHWHAAAWPGKAAMFNHVLGTLREPCVLMQIDADELWQAHQIELIVDMLGFTGASRMDFRCRYFVGPDIVVTSREGYGNHVAYEWRRAWRFTPGMRFDTHEPPKIRGDERLVIGHEQTEDAGLVFDHYAYALKRQVEFKERYYGYAGAVAQWERLQGNTVWPVKSLKSFLPWVNDDVACDRL